MIVTHRFALHGGYQVEFRGAEERMTEINIEKCKKAAIFLLRSKRENQLPSNILNRLTNPDAADSFVVEACKKIEDARFRLEAALKECGLEIHIHNRLSERSRVTYPDK